MVSKLKMKKHLESNKCIKEVQYSSPSSPLIIKRRKGKRRVIDSPESPKSVSNKENDIRDDVDDREEEREEEEREEEEREEEDKVISEKINYFEEGDEIDEADEINDINDIDEHLFEINNNVNRINESIINNTIFKHLGLL
jgi:hypothetical protein